MTAPTGTRTVEPPEGAANGFTPKPAARVSQRNADEAEAEIRRIDGELAELSTRRLVLLAEKLKLMEQIEAAR